MQVRGANGSGKSSLLRLLSGLLPPTRGAVHWRRRHIIGSRDADFAASVAYMGHADGMSGELSVMENLNFSLHLAGTPGVDAQCRDVLQQLRLADCVNAQVRHLSQGQRRRLTLARVILSRRALWLLDEPCAGLDNEGEARFDAYLSEHTHRGGLAVVTTHRDQGRDAPGALTLDLDALNALSNAGSIDSDHRP